MADAALELHTPPPEDALTKAVITQVLGRIEAPGAVVNGKPAPNSTRWIFDVECLPGQGVDLFLIESRSGRRFCPDIMSFSITPCDADCYDARPFADKPLPGADRLVIHTRRTSKNPASIHFRVAVDVMHSATR